MPFIKKYLRIFDFHYNLNPHDVYNQAGGKMLLVTRKCRKL